MSESAALCATRARGDLGRPSLSAVVVNIHEGAGSEDTLGREPGEEGDKGPAGTLSERENRKCQASLESVVKSAKEETALRMALSVSEGNDMLQSLS